MNLCTYIFYIFQIILDERFFEKLVLSFHGNVPKALELMTVSVPDPSL